MASLSLTKVQFENDINLIANSLPAFEKGKVLKWSSVAKPIKVLEDLETKRYFQLTEQYLEHPVRWSLELTNFIKTANMPTDFLEKLKTVKEAFNCLSKTFARYYSQTNNNDFDSAGLYYDWATQVLQEEIDRNLGEQAVLKMQERLSDSNACAKQEIKGTNQPPEQKVPEPEIMIFDLEL